MENNKEDISKEDLIAHINSLESELEECQSNVVQSAEIGKRLLEENGDLKNEIESTVKQYTSQIESLDQKIYELQNRLDCQTQQEQWFNDEMSQLKEELQTQAMTLTEKLEGERQIQVAKLQKQINDRHIDLEECQNAKRQLEDQVKEMEVLLKEKQEINETLSQTFHLEEIGELQHNIMEIQNENATLKGQLIESKADNQKLRVEIDGIKQRLLSKEEEIEELQCQCTSYSNSVEMSKMERMELQAQLDAVKMEMQCHNSKGNSLFSEVEDRRITAEKKIITMKSEYDSLQKRYDFSNQQLRKMKSQMVHYLEMGKGKVDSERIGDLENQLAKERSEKKRLKEQIFKLEKEQEENSYKMRGSQNEVTEKNSSQDYVQYLLTLVKTKSDEITHLKKEMEVQDMLFLDQKSKVFEMQKSLYDMEKEKDKYRVLCLQKNLKLEEMILKYEPDSVKGDKTAIKTRKEKIALPEENKEVVVKDLHSESMRELNRSSMMLSRSILEDSERTKQQRDMMSNKEVFQHEISERHLDMSKKAKLDETVNHCKRSKGKSVNISENIMVVDTNGEIKSQQHTEKPSQNIENMENDRKERKGGKRATLIKNVQPSQREQNAECATQ